MRVCDGVSVLFTFLGGEGNGREMNLVPLHERKLAFAWRFVAELFSFGSVVCVVQSVRRDNHHERLLTISIPYISSYPGTLISFFLSWQPLRNYH